MQELCGKVFSFYRDGFTGMRLGRTLWLIILLKLFVLFCIIKPFLFPDILQTRFQSDADRAAFVFAQLNAAASPTASDATTMLPADTGKQPGRMRHSAAR